MWEALCLSNRSNLFGYFSDFSLNKLSRTALSLQSAFFSATLGCNKLRVIKNYRDIRKWQTRSEKMNRHMWIVWPYLSKVLQPAKGKGNWLFLKELAGKSTWTHVSRKKKPRDHTLDRKGWNTARKHRATYKTVTKERLFKFRSCVDSLQQVQKIPQKTAIQPVCEPVAERINSLQFHSSFVTYSWQKRPRTGRLMWIYIYITQKGIAVEFKKRCHWTTMNLRSLLWLHHPWEEIALH